MCPCQHGCPLLCVVPDPRSLSLPLDCDNTRTGPWMSTSGSGPSCLCWQEQTVPVPRGTPPSWGLGGGCLQQHGMAGLSSHHPAASDGLPAQPCLQAADMTWLGAEATEWRRSSSHLDGCLGRCLSPTCPELGLCLHCFTGPVAPTPAEPPGLGDLRFSHSGMQMSPSLA